jgi:hypothetical protein
MKYKEIIPLEEWEKRLNLSYLRTWCCLANVNVPINKKHKLGPQTVDCVFLGYAFHSVGYKFLIIKFEVPDMHVGTIMESRDATFFENEFPMKSTSSSSNQESIISHEHDNLISDEQIKETHVQSPKENDIIVTRKSKRQRVAKSFGDDYIVYLVDNTPTTIEEAFPLLMLICGRKQPGVDLSIFRVGPKKFLLFWDEKILPMTIPLDASGLNFRARLGLGRAARTFYSVKSLKTTFRAGLRSRFFSWAARSVPTPAQ